jgi:hypothetical protein
MLQSSFAVNQNLATDRPRSHVLRVDDEYLPVLVSGELFRPRQPHFGFLLHPLVNHVRDVLGRAGVTSDFVTNRLARVLI